jgi:hypothetical protein
VADVELTAWQWCLLALVSIVAGVMVANFMKRIEKPDSKKSDK